MKKFMLSILLFGLSVFAVVQCSRAKVNSSAANDSAQDKQQNVEIDYSAPPGAPFTAEEVTIKAKGFTLAGTLLLPKSGARPLPAVITITGSGQ